MGLKLRNPRMTIYHRNGLDFGKESIKIRTVYIYFKTWFLFPFDQAKGKKPVRLKDKIKLLWLDINSWLRELVKETAELINKIVDSFLFSSLGHPILPDLFKFMNYEVFSKVNYSSSCRTGTYFFLPWKSKQKITACVKFTKFLSTTLKSKNSSF